MKTVHCDECLATFPVSEQHSGAPCPRCKVGKLRPWESTRARRTERLTVMRLALLAVLGCGDSDAPTTDVDPSTIEPPWSTSYPDAPCIAAECAPWLCLPHPETHELTCVAPCAVGDPCQCVVVDGVGGCF